jgi:protein transport protein SEC31
MGIVAGGLENGELALWNPKIVIEGGQDSLILKNTVHSGAVRGLDFNPLQSNLLATGAADAEVFIWDLTNPTKPYSPGNKSSRLEDVNAVSWNRQVAHILATASTNGYTVIWDLRNRRELIQLAHPGGRKAITAVSWNPDVATQIITAADDDQNPALQVWDLRNARAPEKSLPGHNKGVLSMAWCPKDSELLLSCGKDNRCLAWNPNTSEMMGEIQRSKNWAFEVQWCPKNPDLLAVASFDGKINIHALQSTSETIEHGIAPSAQDTMHQHYSEDPFNATHLTSEDPIPVQPFVMRRPPKWMRRSVFGNFGIGGKLLTLQKTQTEDMHTNAGGPFGNAPTSLPTTEGSSSVIIHSMPSDPTIKRRIDKLEQVLSGSSEDLVNLCSELASDPTNRADAETWHLLHSLLDEMPREKLLQHLGFNKGHSFGGAEHPVVAEVDGLDGDPAASFSLYPQSVPTKGQHLDTTSPGTVDAVVTRSVLMGDFEQAVESCLQAHRWADALMLAICGGPELLSKTQAQVIKRQKKEQKPYFALLDSVTHGSLQDVVERVDLTLPTEIKNWKDVFALICTYAKADEFVPLVTSLATRLETELQKAGPVKPGSALDPETASKIKSAILLCRMCAGDVTKVAEAWTTREREEERRLQMSAKTDLNLRKRHPHLSKFSLKLMALQSFMEKMSVYKRTVDWQDEDLQVPPVPEGEFHPPRNDLKHRTLYNKYAEYAEACLAEDNVTAAWRALNQVPENFTSATPTGDPEVDAYQTNPIAVLRDRIFHGAKTGELSEAQTPAFPFYYSEMNLQPEPEKPPPTVHEYQHPFPQTPTRQPSFSAQTGPHVQQPSQSAYPQQAGPIGFGTGPRQSLSQPGYQPQPAFGQPAAQTSYARPPPQASYGQPPAQPSYGQQPSPQGYGHAPAQPSYGQLPAQANYGQPPTQASYGQPPTQQSYGQPPKPAQSFGQPPAQSYGQPPAQQNFGQPPAAQQNFGQPPTQSFGQPPVQQNFGQPPTQSYGQPPAQQNFGQPPKPQTKPTSPTYTQPPKPLVKQPTSPSYQSVPKPGYPQSGSTAPPVSNLPPPQSFSQPKPSQIQTSYGQPPAQANAYGQPPAPQNFGQPVAQSYGQPPVQTSPYGQAPAQASFGLPPAQTSPYGQAPSQFGQAPAQPSTPGISTLNSRAAPKAFDPPLPAFDSLRKSSHHTGKHSVSASLAGAAYGLSGTQPATGYSQQPAQGGAYPQQPAQGAYPGQPAQGGSYPQQPAQGGAYPQQPAQGAYPQQPAQGGAYPQQPAQGAYPQQPAQAGAYPQQPAQGGAYPGQPSQSGAYPQHPAQGAYPQQPAQGGYPPQQQYVKTRKD